MEAGQRDLKTFRLWAQVVRWVDADTCHAVIDQGFYTYRGRESKTVSCRCTLINAPELPTPEGQAAFDYACKLVPLGEYECISYKPDEYGRPLIDLILPDGRLFSAAMLAAGMAVPYPMRIVPISN
jgi:endonuclease YncB( thermonuclease family)